jgi:hypothetical protein
MMEFTALEIHGIPQIVVPQADSTPICGTSFKPIPIVIAISVVTALVDPLHLKALLLLPSGSPQFQPVAPDGQPPLPFIEALALSSTQPQRGERPIGVICMGSAMACPRLRPGETFLHGAITALALARMIVTPPLGVGITRWFAHTGFVNRDDKILRFVSMCVTRPRLTRNSSTHCWRMQPFLGSVVSYHSGEPGISSVLISLGACTDQRRTSRKSTRLLVGWNIFLRS